MTDAGIDVNSFSTSVSHGIHSITVEDINSYFDGKVTENNSIPTVNTDLKSPEKVLPYAPRTKRDPTKARILSVEFMLTPSVSADKCHYRS